MKVPVVCIILAMSSGSGACSRPKTHPPPQVEAAATPVRATSVDPDEFRRKAELRRERFFKTCGQGFKSESDPSRGFEMFVRPPHAILVPLPLGEMERALVEDVHRWLDDLDVAVRDELRLPMIRPAGNEPRLVVLVRDPRFNYRLLRSRETDPDRASRPIVDDLTARYFPDDEVLIAALESPQSEEFRRALLREGMVSILRTRRSDSDCSPLHLGGFLAEVGLVAWAGAHGRTWDRAAEVWRCVPGAIEEKHVEVLLKGPAKGAWTLDESDPVRAERAARRALARPLRTTLDLTIPSWDELRFHPGNSAQVEVDRSRAWAIIWLMTVYRPADYRTTLEGLFAAAPPGVVKPESVASLLGDAGISKLEADLAEMIDTLHAARENGRIVNGRLTR